MKQEDALELVKFLNLEEATDLEAAKEKFQENWIKQEEFSSKIGKLTGTIANVTRKAFEPFGIVLMMLIINCSKLSKAAALLM